LNSCTAGGLSAGMIIKILGH